MQAAPWQLDADLRPPRAEITGAVRTPGGVIAEPGGFDFKDHGVVAGCAAVDHTSRDAAWWCFATRAVLLTRSANTAPCNV